MFPVKNNLVSTLSGQSVGMTTPSPLFRRITICSNAIRHRQPDGGGHKSSYDEVVKFLPRDKITDRLNTNLVKASLEYIKLGFRDRSATKAKISLYVASLIADGKDKAGLAKEVCDRFRVIDDFDRNAMEKIFHFSLCNDRVRRLLDNTMISKTENIHPAIKHEFDVELILIFFNVMESLVRRGHALDDLGYVASVTSPDIEGAREIIDKHVSHIATKCSPCFKPKVLKPPRGQSNLFPAGDALPSVSIGCEHVDYDEATIATLKESLLEKEEKGEFLEMMFAAISHASNEPVVTYQGIQLESVKTFFLETILDKSQADETLKTMSVSAEVFELRKELDSVKEEALSREKYWEEKFSSLEQQRLSIGEKHRSLAKEIPTLKRRNEEMEHELPRVKQALAVSEKLADDLNKYYRKNFVQKKSRMSAKEKNDKIWRMSLGNHGVTEEKENVWSGDEEDE